MQIVSEAILSILEKELPSFFTRRIAAEKLNGLFTANALANLEYKKIGPPVHYVGRKACYIRESFIQWLREYFGSMDVTYTGTLRNIRRGVENDR